MWLNFDLMRKDGIILENDVVGMGKVFDDCWYEHVPITLLNLAIETNNLLY